MSENSIFEQDAAKPQGDLAQVSEMAQNLQILENDISILEKELKEKKKERDRIESADLPDLMDSLQLTGVQLPDGSKVSIKSVIKASLPTPVAIDRARGDDREILQQRLEAGLTWLREREADSMIKNIVSADLGKNNDLLAEKIISAIEHFGLKANRSETVHPQTLSAYVRELLESGEDVPFETLSVYSGRKAAITKSR